MFRLADLQSTFTLQAWGSRGLLLAGLVSTSLCLAVGNSVAQQLSPGTTQYKPGTTPTLGPPNYTTALPGYFTVANRVGSRSDFFGSMSLGSTVYRDPATGFLGFQYDLSLSTSGGSLPVTSLSLDTYFHPWQGVTIMAAGAIGNGNSTAGTVAPDWTDGDPIFIFRDTAANGAGITVDFLDANRGSSINGGNTAASLFFTTDATSFTSFSSFVAFNGSTSEEAPGGIIPAPEPAVPTVFALGVAMLVIRRGRTRHSTRSPEVGLR